MFDFITHALVKIIELCVGIGPALLFMGIATIAGVTATVALYRLNNRRT